MHWFLGAPELLALGCFYGDLPFSAHPLPLFCLVVWDGIATGSGGLQGFEEGEGQAIP